MDAGTSTSSEQASQTWAIHPIPNSHSPSPPVDGTIRHYRPSAIKNSHSISRRVSSPKLFKSKKSSFKWVKGELLGKGSYGQVYLALNATTGEIMAVKQVQHSPKSNTMRQPCHFVEALKFESDTLKDLDHPNIVAYLGFEESPEFLSIFLEYVPGGTIGGCLHEQGRFREEVTKSFTTQILKGLEYLHSKGILHRDLKADNILLEPGGICKISDFGISKKVENNHRGRAFTGMKGTVFWMAPETFDSRKQGYDVKVDIWSIGCVVLEMWTGKRPWCGEQHLPVMMKLWKDKIPPPLPSDLILSEAAQDFRQKCFQPDPQKRPSAASLQNHSYLTLPKDWAFNFAEMGYHPSICRTASNASQKSLQKLRLHQTKRKANRPDTLASQQPSNSDPFIQSEGPPVVVIMPLGTKSHASKDGQASQTSLDNCEIPIRKSRLFISNPDPDTDTDQDVKIPSTTYVPPPLPKIDTRMPAQVLQNKPVSPANMIMLSHPHSSSTFTVLQSQTKKNLPKPHLSPFYHSTSSSAFPDFQNSPTSNAVKNDSSIHGWTYEHKLVDDIAVKRAIRVPSLLAVPRPSQAAEWNSSENIGPRPVVEDVVEHLQDFFPDYDLDQAVEYPAFNEPLRKHLTIRKVAEQQVKTSLNTPMDRRRTMLWDSHLEELKTFKKRNDGQNDIL